MAPLEWMVAARYRLGATQPIVPRGGRCVVSGELLDAVGWVTMHSSGAAFIARHDSLTREWVHFAKRCTGGVVYTLSYWVCLGMGLGVRGGIVALRTWGGVGLGARL